VAVNHWPSICGPRYWSQERLPAKVMGHTRDRTKTKKDGPPTAVMGLNKIRVTGTLNRTRFEVSMGQNWISWVGLKRAPGSAAARDCLAVSIFGAALSNHQVIVVCNLVQVRTLWTTAAGSRP